MNITPLSSRDLTIALRPSRYFFMLLSAVHTVVLCLLCLLGFSVWILLGLSGVVLISYWRWVKRYIVRDHPQAILVCGRDHADGVGRWWIKTRGQVEAIPVQFLPIGFASEQVLILRFRQVGPRQRHYWVPVFADMIDQATYRQLRRMKQGYGG
jgi:hypothetical protein